jgi:Family of unknown function (DUF6308)
LSDGALFGDSAARIALTRGFEKKGLAPVPVPHAIQRVVNFCCSPSGFLSYDLAGHQARAAGRLQEVEPWTLLLANALNGRTTASDVCEFVNHMQEFVHLLEPVCDNLALADMDAAHLQTVIEFCMFHFDNVWAAKITKVGALFRPAAIPLLDREIAWAFGLDGSAFRARKEAIPEVVRALARNIRHERALLAHVRDQVAMWVPIAGEVLSELRLAELILWTSMDDSNERTTRKTGRVSKPKNKWLNRIPSPAPSYVQVAPIRLRS